MKKMSLIISALFFFCTGFGQTSKLASYIPAGTETIVLLNPVQIAKKVPKEVFVNSTMYKEMMKSGDKGPAEFFENPSMTGIDFSSDLFICIVRDSTNPLSKPGLTIIASIKDASALEKLVQGMSKEEGISREGNIRFVISSPFAPAVAWNDEVLIMSMSNQKDMIRQMPMISEDSTGAAFEEFQKNLVEAKKKEMLGFFSASVKNSIASNQHFAELLKQSADIRTWSGDGGFFKSMAKSQPALAELFSFFQSMSPNDRVALVNFENGKIVSTSRDYLSPQMIELRKKYPAVEQNFMLARHIPENAKPMLLISAASQPGMMKEVLHNSGIDKMLDSIRSKLPFDPELLGSAFGNQFMMALVRTPGSWKPADPALKNGEGKNEDFNRIFKDFHIVWAMPIRNKENFEKLYSSLSTMMKDLKEKAKKEEDNMETEEDGSGDSGSKFMWQKMLANLKLSVKYNDSICVMSLSESMADAYIKSPGNGALPAWLQSAKKYPMVMNFDFHSFLQFIVENAGKKSDPAETAEMKKMFDKIGVMTITGGDYSNGTLNSRMEFTMGDASKNAMQTLFELMNDLAGTGRRKSAMRDEEMIVPPNSSPVEAPRAQMVPEPPPPPKSKSKTKNN